MIEHHAKTRDKAQTFNLCMNFHFDVTSLNFERLNTKFNFLIHFLKKPTPNKHQNWHFVVWLFLGSKSIEDWICIGYNLKVKYVYSPTKPYCVILEEISVPTWCLIFSTTVFTVVLNPLATLHTSKSMLVDFSVSIKQWSHRLYTQIGEIALCLLQLILLFASDW